MDMDLDFSDDKIESFLSTKLEEFRIKNESLETVLSQHRHALKDSGDNPINETILKVIESDSWKIICNNKYSIGFLIFNSGRKHYKDIKVFLTWDSQETFCYKIETFGMIPAGNEACRETKTCDLVIDTVKKHCDVFTGKTYLVVTFDVPQYINKLEYEISGSLVCNVEGQDFNILFPKVNVSVKDPTLNTNWISQNPLHNVFSMMTCSDPTDLVMILPEEWTASLVSTFEIHCALTHLKMQVTCKSYFLANNVSKLFDNTLIVVHSDHDNKNTLFLKLYVASRDQVYAFCHHLGSCLPNIVFFPTSYYESHLCKNALFSQELLGEFGKSMCQELESSYKFAQSSSYDESRLYNEFRNSLSSIECNTDKLFLKISNMKY